MTYEEYKRIMKSNPMNGNEISVLIRFAMRNPDLHVQYMKRYNEEKVNRSIGKRLKVMEITEND